MSNKFIAVIHGALIHALWIQQPARFLNKTPEHCSLKRLCIPRWYDFPCFLAQSQHSAVKCQCHVKKLAVNYLFHFAESMVNYFPSPFHPIYRVLNLQVLLIRIEMTSGCNKNVVNFNILCKNAFLDLQHTRVKNHFTTAINLLINHHFLTSCTSPKAPLPITLTTSQSSAFICKARIFSTIFSSKAKGIKGVIMHVLTKYTHFL